MKDFVNYDQICDAKYDELNELQDLKAVLVLQNDLQRLKEFPRPAYLLTLLKKFNADLAHQRPRLQHFLTV